MDLLGRVQRVVGDGVELDESQPGRLVLRAMTGLTGIASGRFSQPSFGVRWSAAERPTDLELLGFAFTQFALPVTAGAELGFDFHPSVDLRSPRVVLPLVARSGGRVVLLAPIDHPHEQVIAVRDGMLAWGWHGDLDAVEAGFATTLGIYESGDVEGAFAQWRGDLAPVRRSRENLLVSHLSYWTDNGAAYWYRTEAGQTIAESVVAVVDDLRSNDVPVRSVEIDSWFYEHETPRPIAEIGYPDEVPPTGAMTWMPRPDAFPTSAPSVDSTGDPMEVLQRRLEAPTVLHARHIAPTSPYIEATDEWWVDEIAAHPKDPEFFRRWFDDARRWGALCIEQDWMLVYWFGVRALREQPGRAAHWQRTLNRLAGETGVDLMWCMATPADLVLAASLKNVVAVRTSDDYRFAGDPAFLWTWFLVVNRLANTLGLPAFKDCFFSEPSIDVSSDPIDGDPHAELEAALSALSGGAVGIGDRLGRTNREIVMRCCDDDGRLRRVDRAIAAVDDSLFGGPAAGDGLMWATTAATDAAGEWRYALAIHTAETDASIRDRFPLDATCTVYDWRARVSFDAASLEVELSARDWSLFVVSPAGAPSADAVGDPSKYVVVEATAGGGDG